MKQTNNKNWVDNVMQSLEGKQNVPAPDFLLGNIEKELFGKVIPMSWIVKWSAAAVLILGLNIYALQQSNAAVNVVETTVDQQSTLLNYDYNLYE